LGEVYYTSDISHIIKNKYTKNRLKFIRKEFQIENNIISNIQLYDYQKNIIDISNNFYQNNNSGIISMPCGTGKTLIGYSIASKYNIIIFITPLKQYAKQNI
ncbi:MAG: DEAD/DEAH box helicase family protein, partial [Candidatus Fonsibacter sp.]